MTHSSKQFAASDTGSRRRNFRQAKLRLTAFYCLIFAIFLLVFSLVLYYSFDQKIRTELDGDFTNEQAQKIAVATAVDRLRDNIVWLDVTSFLIFGSLSYFAAVKTLKPIEISLESQQRFMADASHELRTPITVMRTSFEVFLRKRSFGPEIATNTVQGGLEEIERMERLVNDLRTLARLDGSSFSPDSRSEFDQALSRSIRSLSPYAHESGIELVLTRNDTCIVSVDELNLEQICANLIKNAIEYSPSGSKVTISLAAENEAVMIVRDTGIGISANDLPRIFDRFFRAEDSRSRRTGGSGLGLAIVKDSIDSAGGVISIESSLGKGTVATIRLPLIRHS